MGAYGDPRTTQVPLWSFHWKRRALAQTLMAFCYFLDEQTRTIRATSDEVAEYSNRDRRLVKSHLRQLLALNVLSPVENSDDQPQYKISEICPNGDGCTSCAELNKSEDARKVDDLELSLQLQWVPGDEVRPPKDLAPGRCQALLNNRARRCARRGGDVLFSFDGGDDIVTLCRQHEHLSGGAYFQFVWQEWFTISIG